MTRLKQLKGIVQASLVLRLTRWRLYCSVANKFDRIAIMSIPDSQHCL